MMDVTPIVPMCIIFCVVSITILLLLSHCISSKINTIIVIIAINHIFPTNDPKYDVMWA